ncbi:MAG: M20/M25/M40 family metallo-hydrolase [Deltaproteobacteria bacterium]|nr:M20/M25/M40 family metallo-hydrolase [Deltaproteobacteria bacterium]
MQTIAVLLTCAAIQNPAAPGAGAPAAATAVEPTSILIGNALASDRAYERLRYLSDRIGARLAGSPNLEAAVQWALAEIRRDGLERVRTDPVLVPHWVRGTESARLLNPLPQPLPVLGLGGTVATPAGGITAPVVGVRSMAELPALRERARGAIVLFNCAMPPAAPPFEAYDKVYDCRSDGASAAAKLGAVAVLVRSLTTRSLRTLHTGTLWYEDKVKKIPAASISVEDAELIQRALDRDEQVRVKLELGARQLPEARSANVIAEWRGRERPDEIVLIGAHLDSWDVSPGAQDNGAGVVVAMEVVSLLRQQALRPRRTVRLVLFTNEENGMRGAHDYFRRHGAEHHVAAIELDRGAGRPVGWSVDGSEATLDRARELAHPLRVLGAERVEPGFAGVDLIPLTRAGVAGLELEAEADHYFDIHHSAADTFEKVDRLDLALQAAAAAAMVWQLAEVVDPLPPGVRKKDDQD